MQPICTQYRVLMKCSKNDLIASNAEVEGQPSTYWQGDMYECPVCGAGVVTGMGEPLAASAGIVGENTFEFHHEPEPPTNANPAPMNEEAGEQVAGLETKPPEKSDRAAKRTECTQAG